MIAVADRVRNLAPYLFAQIEQKIEKAKEQGVDVISLGIGDPDLPTPEPIVAEAECQLHNPENHRYPSSKGMKAYRQAVADYYRRRFGVDLNPETEVVTLIGSKEGIAHISLCYVNPGDVNIVPDPGYPVYEAGTIFAGGEVYRLALKPDKGFLPDLASVPTDVARRAKIMFLNYPNNPTGAVADAEFFREAVEFARTYDVLICHDAAYAEIGFDGYRPPSFLGVPGAKEVGMEFGSVSKTANMTGWRIAWACGNPDAIKTLTTFKTNIDSGQFQAVQYAGIVALREVERYIGRTLEVYTRRRDKVISALREMGWKVEPPKATIYVWAPVPEGFTSISFAEHVFEKAHVVITPGNGYGPGGEGFFRLSLTTPDDRLDEALRRLMESGIRYK